MTLDSGDMDLLEQLRKFSANDWAMTLTKAGVRRALRLCEIALQHEGAERVEEVPKG